MTQEHDKASIYDEEGRYDDQDRILMDQANITVIKPVSADSESQAAVEIRLEHERNQVIDKLPFTN